MNRDSRLELFYKNSTHENDLLKSPTPNGPGSVHKYTDKKITLPYLKPTIYQNKKKSGGNKKETRRIPPPSIPPDLLIWSNDQSVLGIDQHILSEDYYVYLYK